MLTDYPTLMRPLLLRNSRYNQHATHGSLLLEVGTAGNAPEEAELSRRPVCPGAGAGIGGTEQIGAQQTTPPAVGRGRGALIELLFAQSCFGRPDTSRFSFHFPRWKRMVNSSPRRHSSQAMAIQIPAKAPAQHIA